LIKNEISAFETKAIVEADFVPGSAFWRTQPNTVVVWRPAGTTTWRTLLYITSCSILANWPHGMKTWRHPQNRKYTTYRNVVRGEPRP